METIFKTRINATPSEGEIQLNRDILTVPDSAHSMREILHRFSQGIPLTGRSNPVYNPEWEYDDFANMDIEELETLKEEYRRSVSVKRKEVIADHMKKQKEEDEKLKEKQKSELRKQVESEIRESKGKDRSGPSVDV